MPGRKAGVIAALLVLSLGGAGCSEPEPGLDAAATTDAEAGVGTDLRIMPFTPPELTLQINETHDQWVNLSRPADKTVHVDILAVSASVTTSPTTLAYAAGEDQDKLTLTAVSETGGVYVPVRFLLRGTKSSRTLRVKVVLW